MTFRWASASHVGRMRSNNEDSVHPPSSGAGPGPLTVAVADGMGGHAAGDVASRLALEGALEGDRHPRERVEHAHRKVVEAAQGDARLSRMGTTLTLAQLTADGRVVIGHVGDSRAYRHRDGRLEQLTTDHSLMSEYLAAGKIEPQEARTHPLRSVVTRAVGIEDDFAVDVLDDRLEPGDRLLLCSDGLTSMVPDDRIAEVLEETADPDDATWRLVEEANRAGGEDNISVVLVDVEP